MLCLEDTVLGCKVFRCLPDLSFLDLVLNVVDE